ncbi:hypothetical protein BXZ70DRAFT_775153 [Cristinia sonorae]|uniref:Uncharacterized protein n=1 Tax=Cristinia sonorae TaxID=1940300 RepID=A0A8K0UCR3_9AGAR|nr:hypothetical protein BXZ70DRAFT_775153 [Cristinia sonorae]
MLRSGNNRETNTQCRNVLYFWTIFAPVTETLWYDQVMLSMINNLDHTTRKDAMGRTCPLFRRFGQQTSSDGDWSTMLAVRILYLSTVTNFLTQDIGILLYRLIGR